jgi:O-antigen/teichoic acid export membrane protein
MATFNAEAAASAGSDSTPVVDPRRSEKHTYRQILKATALVGGSSAVSIAFGILRNKAMALLLGPAGVGLFGLYGSVADLAQSVAGMGIPNSGVRQIAEAAGSRDAAPVARTATVLRRISLLLGVLGAVPLVVFAGPISQLTFGSRAYAGGVALLSLVVVFRLVSAGQAALIQGMRRIPDLARMNVVAAVFGTLVTILLVYWLREQGVVPSLVAIAAASILTSWYYSRKVHVPRVSLAFSQIRDESAALLKLGVAFMASGLLTMGAAYLIRIIVMRMEGFEAAGLYQAAWALGGLYVGFILQAMGTDFYPRLTAVSRDNPRCNRLVNEQAEISLLLAGPGVLATLTFAPLVMAAFYSAEFGAAVGLLRWICFGMMLRVIAWPMGFIVVAKGAQQIFFWTEAAATIVHVGLAWLFVSRFGVEGAGAAFFALYLWHGLLIYAVVRRLSGFRWSATNRRLGLILVPVTMLVFVSFYVLPWWLATTVGLTATLLSGVHSLRTLATFVSPDAMPYPISRLMLRLQPVPADSGPHR